LNTFFNFYWTY